MRSISNFRRSPCPPAAKRRGPPSRSTADPDRHAVRAEGHSGRPGGHSHHTGILNGKLRGFYLSKANGRNYAVTQFDSTDARRALPSYDEPAFKATF
jgi:hypothetical protein